MGGGTRGNVEVGAMSMRGHLREVALLYNSKIA